MANTSWLPKSIRGNNRNCNAQIFIHLTRHGVTCLPMEHQLQQTGSNAHTNTQSFCNPQLMAIVRVTIVLFSAEYALRTRSHTISHLQINVSDIQYSVCDCAAYELNPFAFNKSDVHFHLAWSIDVASNTCFGA